MRECSNCGHHYAPASEAQQPCPRCGYMQGLSPIDASLIPEIGEEEPTTSRYRVRTLARLSFIFLVAWLWWVISEHLPA